MIAPHSALSPPPSLTYPQMSTHIAHAVHMKKTTNITLQKSTLKGLNKVLLSSWLLEQDTPYLKL